MGLNNLERERLEKLSDIELVEHLLHLKYECDDLFNKREMNRNNQERWEFYHDAYYEKTSVLIEVKYMILKRMVKV